MQLNPKAMDVAAEVMLTVFAALSAWSLLLTIRQLRRKAEPDPKKLAAARRSLKICTRIMFGAIAGAIYAIWSHEYLLLIAAGMLFSLAMPVLVLYAKTWSALRKTRN